MGGRAQDVARLLAAGRTLFGVACLVAPQLAEGWIGKGARNPGARVIIRAFGARDAALGIGTTASIHDAKQLRRWLIVSSGCDAVDFVATLAGPRSPARNAVLALAAGATVTGLGAAVSI